MTTNRRGSHLTADPGTLNTNSWTPIPDPTLLTTEQSNRLRDEMQRELSALREIIDARLNAQDHTVVKLEARVNEHYSLLSKEIAVAEVNRKEALDKAAATIQTWLAKAERTMQLSLGDTKKDLQISLGEAEQRVSEKFQIAKDATEKTQYTLAQLHNEKFASIQKQFDVRDVRAEQAAIATKIAVDAALQAQKEAAGAQNESNAAAITKSEAATVKQIDGLQALMKGSTDATNDKIGSLMSRLDRGEGGWRGSSDTRTERRLDLGSTLGIAGVAVSILAAVMVVISHLAPAPNPYPAIVTPTVPTQPR